jgi:hypothetical protein
MRRSRIASFALFACTLACSHEASTVEKKPPQPAPAPAPAVKPTDPAAQAPAAPAVEPDYITVQHCLIAFKGSLPKPTVTRTKEEAKTLAYEILEKARKGEDFDALVKQYTDDAAPGIYTMANTGKPPRNPIPKEFPRGKMVAAFGDTGFPLPVGGYGIADYDPKKSPYGWHIVKRIE